MIQGLKLLTNKWPGMLQPKTGKPLEQTRSSERSGPEAVAVKEATRFRILHLSDIHFGSDFDASVWEYISALVRRERPNVLACTGDIVDHGGLFMLASAKQEFENLRKDSNVEFLLRCVPGNHDSGPWGNLKFWPFSSNFAAVFGPRAMTIGRFVPSFSRYRNWSIFVRWPVRLVVTTVLYANKMWAGIRQYMTGKPMSELPLTRDDDPDDVVFVYLDSTFQLLLAAGNVDVKQVMRLKSYMLNMRDIDGSRPFAPRIALLHHHPLPIPDAKITEGLTSFEPFLVLRNAGVVLRELNRCDVDLVLHGHKHYASFARLGYSLDHRVEGEIAVLAAGSAGITHAEQGRNSVNFIDVFKSGRMAYTTVSFGGGASGSVTELFRATHFVHGMEMHKMRMGRRATERHGQWIERIEHDVRVDSGGVAVVEHKVEKHHFDRDLEGSEVPLRINVSMGRVPPTTLVLTEESVRAGHQIKNPPKAPERRIACAIDLGQSLVAASPPATYSYSYVSFNTYAITEWETAKAAARETRLKESRGQAVGLEFSSIVVRVPVVKLIFRLSLPLKTVAPDPKVRVMRWGSYPGVALDGQRQFSESDNAGWVFDSDITQHEKGRLARTGENEWELSISNPMVGHRYDIRWRVRDRVRDTDQWGLDTERRGLAEVYREALLGLEDNRARASALKGWAKAFLEELCEPNLSSAFPEEDALEVAIFAYDDCKQQLKLVQSYPGSDAAESLPLEIPLSEGVVGAAFKRTAVVCYVDPGLSGSRDDAAYLYERAPDGQWKAPKWKYVVAFPIFADPDRFDPDGTALESWSPAATVGVLTISSACPASGLGRLAEGVAAGDLANGWGGQSRPAQSAPTPALDEVARLSQGKEPAAQLLGDAQVSGTIFPEAVNEGDERVASASVTAAAPVTTPYATIEWPKVWAYAHILLHVLENPHLFEPEVGDSAT